jgi:hypothetical protein
MNTSSLFVGYLRTINHGCWSDVAPNFAKKQNIINHKPTITYYNHSIND